MDFWFGRRGSGVVVVGSGFNCVGLGLIVLEFGEEYEEFEEPVVK